MKNISRKPIVFAYVRLFEMGSLMLSFIRVQWLVSCKYVILFHMFCLQVSEISMWTTK